MKQLIVVALLFVTVLFAESAFAGNNPWMKKLPFKVATIHYNISGTEQGSQTMYIKDYGETTALHRNTVMNMFGMTQRQDTIQITTPDWVYDIDLTNRSGSKSVNPAKYMLEEYNRLSASDRKKADRNAEKMGAQAVNNMQGNIQKNAAKLLGYSCDLVSMMGVTVYSIAGTGVELKSESNMMGVKALTVATKIDKGNPPKSKFTPPAGIDLRPDPEADAMARQMARSMVQSMVNGTTPTMGEAMQRGGGQGYQPPPQDSGNSAAPPAGMEEMMKGLQGLFGN